jgi:chemotaxis protein CheZ
MGIAHIIHESMAPTTAANATNANTGSTLSSHDVFVRIGMLTRNLHDTLRQLGYDKDVENAVGALPDARARLDYIATLTGKAAECVLDAAECAASALRTRREEIDELHSQWVSALNAEPDALVLHALGRRTLHHFEAAQGHHEKVNGELTKIMLAQDFHELTGQVIQRVTRLAQSLEEQLVKLLLDASPPMRSADVIENALAGPVINGANRDDVVTNQGQVDDLLESLGF